MKPHQCFQVFVQIIILSLVLCGLWMVDFWMLRFQPFSFQTGARRFLAAFLFSTSALPLAKHLSLSGWGLGVVLWIVAFTTNALMTAVEAVYLKVLLPLVPAILVNGAIQMAVYCAVAVAFVGEQKGNEVSAIKKPWRSFSIMGWTWRMMASGVIWVILFVLFGALVFINLARLLAPIELANYSNMDMPSWILGFQFVRGVAWGILCLPVLWFLTGSRFKKSLVFGCFLALGMGVNLILADSLSSGLLISHFVEVVGENFVFGVLLVKLTNFHDLSQK